MKRGAIYQQFCIAPGTGHDVLSALNEHLGRVGVSLEPSNDDQRGQGFVNHEDRIEIRHVLKQHDELITLVADGTARNRQVEDIVLHFMSSHVSSSRS